MRWVSKTNVKLFRLEFFDWQIQSKKSVKQVESKELFFDCVRKPDFGVSRKKPFSTDKSDCVRNSLASESPSEVYSTRLVLVLISP